MNAKEINVVISEAVEAHTDETPATREAIILAILTADPTTKVTTVMSHITKAFKEAGIIAIASVSALAECREYLKTSMPDMEVHKDMSDHASDMQDKFEINADHDKGVKSALKLIKEQLKEDSLFIPKRVQMGMVRALKLEYYNDEENDTYSVDGLTDYIIENGDFDDSVLTDDFKDGIRKSASSDFSFCVGMKKGLNVEDMN